MTGERLARVQLKWGNPYTSPPDNQPRIIFDKIVNDQAYQVGAIEEVIKLEQEYPPGSGWSWHWSLGEEKPRRKWSKEAKARVRKKKLKTRLQTKFPLFWEDMYAKRNVRPQRILCRGRSRFHSPVPTFHKKVEKIRKGKYNHAEHHVHR